MKKSCIPAILSMRLSQPFIIALLLSTAAISALGQTTSSYDGKTPSGLAPGSPAGSYALSDFDTINLYNGKLNFRLPLITIGGRGSTGFTKYLTIEKRWDVKSMTQIQNCNPGGVYLLYHLLAQRHGMGRCSARPKRGNINRAADWKERLPNLLFLP